MLFDRSVYAVLTCFKCFQENLRDVVLNLRNTHLLLSNLHTLNVYFNSNQHSHLEYKISWRIKLDDLLQFSIVATCLNSNIIWATIYVVLRAFFINSCCFCLKESCQNTTNNLDVISYVWYSRHMSSDTLPNIRAYISNVVNISLWVLYINNRLGNNMSFSTKIFFWVLS